MEKYTYDIDAISKLREAGKSWRFIANMLGIKHESTLRSYIERNFKEKVTIEMIPKIDR